MFIPDYQIHNILKAFTRQLKNGARQPDDGRRMETVVRKVAGTIMRRVVYLGEEEARRRHRSPRPPFAAVGERTPEPFLYQTLGSDHRKRRQSLALENSRELIQRFHAEMEASAEIETTP